MMIDWRATPTYIPLCDSPTIPMTIQLSRTQRRRHGRAQGGHGVVLQLCFFLSLLVGSALATAVACPSSIQQKHRLSKWFLASPRGGGTPSSSSSSSITTTAPKTKTSFFLQSLIAGGASRALAQMLLYPIDALRTLAQTRDGRTLADVGVSTLVRGSMTTSSFALFMGAMQFSIFGATKGTCGPLLASALGAAGSLLVSVPQEVIKQRLVTNIYPSFRAAVASIAKTEGVLGFYSAWKPTMARNVPFVVITFTAQDWMKTYLGRRRQISSDNKHSFTVMENALVGMAAALGACVLTNPVDVVKTRMMTQAASSQAPYKSALDCFATILRTEGVATFYSGFQQRTTYMCLLWGVTFALNGRINQMLQQKGEEKR